MGVLFWLYVEARNCAAQQVAKILEANAGTSKAEE
ncbi:hypothetical protein N597_06985 [Streptococcus ilei]|nr:hypothetical protein N597_06985 [Streptococcus ilei]